MPSRMLWDININIDQRLVEIIARYQWQLFREH